jgi:uncharacterized membrane protein
MSLYHFHRVLITAAILFDFFFTFWAIRQYQAPDGAAMDLVMAIGSSVVTVALVAYLVYFNRNLAVLRHVIHERHGAGSLR